MKRATIKSGICVFTGALVRVLEYGKVAPADVFQVGETIVVRFSGSIHDGQWQDQVEHSHTLLLGLDGFLLDGPNCSVAAVPMQQFEGRLNMRNGGIVKRRLGELPMTYTLAQVRDGTGWPENAEFRLVTREG